MQDFGEVKLIQAKERNNGALFQSSTKELGTSGLRGQAPDLRNLVIPQEEKTEWRRYASLSPLLVPSPQRCRNSLQDQSGLSKTEVCSH